MRSRLETGVTLLLLLVSLCTLGSALAEDQKIRAHSCSEFLVRGIVSHKMSHSESARLQACIAAIDQQQIVVGMNVLDLDRLIGSKFAEAIPPIEDGKALAECKFGDREFSWRLVGHINGRGELLGYCLRRTGKNDSMLEPPTVRTAQLVKRFRKAKTPSQKLACTIHAIESRIVKSGVQRSTVVSIFGDSTEDRLVKTWSGYPVRELDLVSSFVFGTSRNSWRLITSGSSERIYDYLLTNYDCDIPDLRPR